MTLPSSGPITAAQIRAELQLAPGTPFTIPADVRVLTGIPSGPIRWPQDFWGKSLRGITQTDFQGLPNSNGANTSTWTSVNFGTPAANSFIVLGIWHGDTNSNPGLAPTCTAGGAGTTRYEPHSTGDDTSGTDAVGTVIFIGNPAASSGSVVVSNWLGSPTPKNLICFRLTGYNSVPIETHGNHGTGSSGSSTWNVPQDAALIYIAGSGQSNTTMSWTGLTTRGEQLGVSLGANNRIIWGWDYNMPANGALVTTVSPWSTAQGSNSKSGVLFSKV